MSPTVDRVARGCVTGVALLLRTLVSLTALWFLGATFGSTADCVAYDKTLLSDHRAVGALVVALHGVTWVLGTIRLRRAAGGWPRVARAGVIPVALLVLLVAGQVVLSAVPAVLDVSDDRSSSCF